MSIPSVSVCFASLACVALLILISRNTLSGSISSASILLKIRMLNRSLALSVSVHLEIGIAAPPRGLRLNLFTCFFFVFEIEANAAGVAISGIFRDDFVGAFVDLVDERTLLCDVLRTNGADLADAAPLAAVGPLGVSGEGILGAENE